ncbi:MAG: dethiobiotin synthase [Panacagrimonas sp.]
MSRTLFVTGTDTEVGKTQFSVGLISAARRRGVSIAGFKPVASGCRNTKAGLRNADALALKNAAQSKHAYEAINPYAFAPPIAPHLAARAVGASIRGARLDAAFRRLAADHDWVLVEGAGGWQVPLNRKSTFADWVSGHQWPVLLVVSLRLGCINHGLLSAEAIAARTPLLGWVANPWNSDQSAHLQAQLVDDLRARISAPLLGVLPTPAPPSANAFDQMWARLNSQTPE